MSEQPPAWLKPKRRSTRNTWPRRPSTVEVQGKLTKSRSQFTTCSIEGWAREKVYRASDGMVALCSPERMDAVAWRRHAELKTIQPWSIAPRLDTSLSNSPPRDHWCSSRSNRVERWQGVSITNHCGNQGLHCAASSRAICKDICVTFCAIPWSDSTSVRDGNQQVRRYSRHSNLALGENTVFLGSLSPMGQRTCLGMQSTKSRGSRNDSSIGTLEQRNDQSQNGVTTSWPGPRRVMRAR